LIPLQLDFLGIARGYSKIFNCLLSMPMDTWCGVATKYPE